MKKVLFVISLCFFSVAVFCEQLQILQTTDSDFYSGQRTSVAVSGTGEDAFLALDHTVAAFPGNQMVITGSTAHQLYNMPDRLSMPFSYPAHITVTAVIIYNYWEGTAGKYYCGIAPDIDASGTSPNPNAMITAGNFNILQNALGSGSTYYSYVTLNADAVINSGAAYHVYIMAQSGVDGSNFARFSGVTPNNKMYAPDGKSNASASVMQSTNNGVTWSLQDSQPIVVLEYLDAESSTLNSRGQKVSYTGSPYYIYTDRSVYGNNDVGQEYEVISDTVISKLRVYISGIGSTPADDLHIVFQDITDAGNILTMTDEVFLQKNDVFGGFSWQTHNMSAPQTLEGGKRYRIFFRSAGSSVSNCYSIRGVNVFDNAQQDTVIARDRILSSTFGGTASYLVSSVSGGTSWDAQSYTQDLLLMIVDSDYSVYSSSGEFISQAFDTRGSSVFGSISWKSLTQCASCGADSVRFQAAAGNNAADTLNFKGPDGTAATWYTQPGALVPAGIFANKRFLRYKLSLASSDVAHSPHVDEVEIKYDTRPSASGEIKLTAYPNPFTPGKEKIGIRYTLTENSDVTINIMTPLMENVKAIRIKAGEEGGIGTADGYDNSVLWDGKNSLGAAVESGSYICIVEIKEGAKKFIRKIAVIR